MDWKKIKTVMIIVLAIVNVFLVYNIISERLNNDYIDEETINNSAEILSRAGINISPSTIPKRKPNADVYETLVVDSYNEDVAGIFLSSDIEKTFSIPDGMRFVTAGNDVIEIYNLFGIVYTSGLTNGAESFDDLVKRANDNVIPEDSKITFPNKSLLKKLENYLDVELYKDTSHKAIKNMSFRRLWMYYDTQTGMYVIKYIQTIGKSDIYGNEVYCVLNDDNILHINGKWSFLPIHKQYSSQLYDQINILFMEKKNIEDESRTIFENESTKIKNEYNINGLDLGYCTYFNENKTGFYYIPAWQISYDDNTSSVYNAVNGIQYVQAN